MKKSLSIMFILALILTVGLCLAEAKHVGPLELTRESCDLDNGEFWFVADVGGGVSGNSFPMTLYLEDRYSLEEIRNLKKDDTVTVDGKTYTVDAVVIHGWYDSDGDGDLDAGSITVDDPETAVYLLEKYETEIDTSIQNLIPESYEIYFTEDYEGYLAFEIGDDGYCHPVVNDDTFRTKIGTVDISLPLPENFVYHYEENWKVMEGTVQDFLNDLNVSSQFHSLIRFEDGKPVEAWYYQ